ncbi:unknown [Prevotella sp. CAG:1058]|nr:unknown [Prevotella sp. CAG:1058]
MIKNTGCRLNLAHGGPGTVVTASPLSTNLRIKYIPSKQTGYFMA